MAFSNFKSVEQVIQQYPLKIRRELFLPDTSVELPEWFLNNLNFALLNQAEKAIATAQQHEYLNEEALTYELTAQFYQTRKERQLAHYYFRNAYHAYQRWGATAKLPKPPADTLE